MKRRTASLAILGLLACLTAASPGTAGAGQAGQPAVHHVLTVRIDPDRHYLHATDRLMLSDLPAGPHEVRLLLNAALHVSDLHRVDQERTAVPFRTVPAADIAEGAQWLLIQVNRNSTAALPVVLECAYEGPIDEPPREPRHLRFVTPSETAGHIGPEGVYLSSETHWYPDVTGVLATFRVQVVLPEGWISVTQGRQTQEGSPPSKPAEWEISVPTEALTLVANRFLKQERAWHDIEVSTYFLSDTASLADQYLEAAIRYLDTYSQLLGPYPFPKFAVVENFFASGLGLPSFTLLGSGVIKRHYVQPYALGHEIVHSWLGNWVLNKLERGNWVEGLTTYLANYYYEELTGTPEQAREQRRMMLLGYAVHVTEAQDYPVAKFQQKKDQTDNAIGYQKAAMVFHLLRREVGEDPFWRGIRQLVVEYGGRYADWQDLARVFSAAAGSDLDWFFVQWVAQGGAPVMSLREAIWQDGLLRVRLSQDGSPYRIQVPLAIEVDGGSDVTAWLRMDRLEQTFEVPTPTRPRRVRLDPGHETFRRLTRQEVPPILNLFVTDPQRVVLLPGAVSDQERQAYHELAQRLRAQGDARAVTVVRDEDFNRDDRLEGSVLILGGPQQNRALQWGIRRCGDETIELGQDTIRIAGHTYQDPGLAVLVTCRDPAAPDHVVSMFYGASPGATMKVGRLLFFYGWHSYVIFRDGRVMTRGDFPTPHPAVEVVFE